MNFSEALKAMKMGSKVSREAWRGKVSYWHREGEKILATYPNETVEAIHSMIIEDILAEDWWTVV